MAETIKAKAELYRLKAREMEAAADSMTDPSVKRSFLELAAQYDTLAHQFEAILD